jgi:hypothetical protein
MNNQFSVNDLPGNVFLKHRRGLCRSPGCGPVQTMENLILAAASG